MAKRARIQSDFTLGGEQAEADPLLLDAFYPSADSHVIRSRTDPRCFIVGRTGSGKSAMFQNLETNDPDHVIRVNPEDLSLPYITDLQVIRYLDELNVNLDLFWIALWKHVLLVEIIRHHYKVDTPATKQTRLATLRAKIARDPAKKAALEYLDEFGDRFWCETEERVKDITDKFSNKIEGELALGSAPLATSTKASIGAAREASSEVRMQQAQRFQRIVNETQLAKLNKMIEVLNEDILDNQHYTYLVIDDLDRDWVDERLANDLIRCLFRSVLDLKRVRNLKLLVALRTNIFQQLDFGRRSGGQEEKFRSLVLSVRWTRADLEALLDERVRVAAPRVGLDSMTLEDLLPHPNKTRNPTEFLLDRTLLRPRDAIAFMNECLAVGIGKTRLTWENINAAEATYSAKRLLALRDEWKPTYPGIEAALAMFRRCPARMTREDMQKRLEDIMVLLGDGSFPGQLWLTAASSRMWTPGDASWFDLYQPLLALLFNIGFLGVAVGSVAAPIFFSDDPLLMDSESALERASAFFVQRTYQHALDVQQGGPS